MVIIEFVEDNYCITINIDDMGGKATFQNLDEVIVFVNLTLSDNSQNWAV